MKNTAADVVLPSTTGAGKAADVESYLAACPEPHRATLQSIRAAIRAAVPKTATEAISYGIPTFRYNGGLVAYAAFKSHCSFFPMSGRIVEQFADELKAWKTSKGTIQFPADKPLPAALVKKMVKARVIQNDLKPAKAGARQK